MEKQDLLLFYTLISNIKIVIEIYDLFEIYDLIEIYDLFGNIRLA